MYGIFDKNKYKSIVKKNNLSQKDIVRKLNDDYNIDITLGGVKSWTRTTLNAQGEIFQPNIKTLNALADMCNCSIQDFFSDAESKRQQIAIEEISSKPDHYSNSISKAFLSTMPSGLDKLIENFLLLNDEQQSQVKENVKELAMKNMKF